METISSESIAPSNPTGARSTFLTVICILTFIGSGWGLISAVRGYAAADSIATIASGAMKNAENTMDQQNTPDFAKQLVSSMADDINPDSIRKESIFKLISNLLTLMGAILMWNLKKPGFYLYIAGIIVLVAAPMLMGKLLGAIGGAFAGFIGVIFIVMYGVNLKCMSNPASENSVEAGK